MLLMDSPVIYLNVKLSFFGGFQRKRKLIPDMCVIAFLMLLVLIDEKI